MSDQNTPEKNIKVTLIENRKFEPTPEFVSKANVNPSNYSGLVEQGLNEPEKYWEAQANKLTWFKKWNKVLEWNSPNAKWFVGGKINASFNCLDRNLKQHAKKAALIWEGEPGDHSLWTYQELYQETEKFTAGLRKLGLKAGDVVAIYMPMVPEAVVAMLACARAGLTHTVIFGGFSAEALKDRMNDSKTKAIITADFGWRKGGEVKLLDQVNLALPSCPTVQHTVVLQRSMCGRLDYPETHTFPHTTTERKQIDYHQMVAAIHGKEKMNLGLCEELDSEHPLFILYTSGTTGKPKGLLHTTGGYMTGCLSSTESVFDLKASDTYWCTADIGWVTGHSYVVYGPLSLGATVFLYEGAPTTPTADRFWHMISQHKVSVFYTAPTAIRAFMKFGVEHPKKHDLSSLRLLGTVGEPINPEAWMWYRHHIGGDRCPIVDTYWQTETGSIVISPLPGVVPTKPGSATKPLPGYDVAVVDKAGNGVPTGSGGYLVIRKPWPSMARTIHGDNERFKKTYFSDFADGIYFTGDGARQDEDGYIWCLGRVDDVLNVSGHRLGTMEVESALVSNPKVAEAAVVGRPDELKGQAVVAFVTLKTEYSKLASQNPGMLKEIEKELKAHVTKEIGAIARPDDIRFSEQLPKTRSGKIMRRLLRELATSGQVKGDITTLEDLAVIASLQKDEE